MNAGAMPLFVVDGMPYENTYYSTSLIGNYFANPLASIDPKDIESMTVLRDGTSLYGSKGANGVILINTLKSKSLETRINARVSTGIGFEPGELPVLSSAGHKFLLSELYQKAYPTVSPAAINEYFPFLNRNKPVKQPWGYEGNMDYYRYNALTNWQKEIYAPSWNQDYYLNVSGGDEIATYVLSLGYLKHEGTVKNTDFSRFNTRFNSEIKFSNAFKVLANMSFMYSTKHLPNEGDNVYLNPMLAALVKAPFTAPVKYSEEGKESPNFEDADYWNLSNPYVLVNNKSNLLNINYRFFGSFEFVYNISRHLDMAALIGLNFNKEREKAFYPSIGVGFPSFVSVDIFNWCLILKIPCNGFTAVAGYFFAVFPPCNIMTTDAASPPNGRLPYFIPVISSDNQQLLDMDIIVIEKQAFERMKRSFENFTHQVRELCESRQDKSEWLTGEEVCTLLRISKRTLQTYRDTGIIPCSRTGRKYFYKTSDVERLINQLQTKKQE
jgi:TonB-dependent SusC/RagA subfamily outer membrane receptor